MADFGEMPPPGKSKVIDAVFEPVSEAPTREVTVIMGKLEAARATLAEAERDRDDVGKSDVYSEDLKHKARENAELCAAEVVRQEAALVQAKQRAQKPIVATPVEPVQKKKARSVKEKKPTVEKGIDPLAAALKRVREDYRSGDPARMMRAEADLVELQRMIPIPQQERQAEFAQNVELARSAEILKARYKTKAERERLFQRLVRKTINIAKSRKGRAIEDIEREIVQEIALDINKDLEKKDTGTLSEIRRSTGGSKVGGKALTALKLGLVYSETSTLSGIFTYLSQTLMGTTLVVSAANPVGIATFALCALGSVALAPLIEAFKDKGVFKPIINRTYRAEIAKQKAKDTGVPVKKDSLMKNAIIAFSTVGAVGGVAAVTQAPQVHMTAGILTSGGETSDFATDTDNAAAAAAHQRERIIRLREQRHDAEGRPVLDEHGQPIYEAFSGELPPEVQAMRDALNTVGNNIVAREAAGDQGGEWGGGGGVGYHDRSALKDYLIFGSLAHRPVGETNTFDASVAHAQALRGGLRYQRFNPDGTPMRGEAILHPDGTPMLAPDGEPVYGAVYESITLEEGQSIAEWFDTRYAAFEERAHSILVHAIEQSNATLEQKEYIRQSFSAVGRKEGLLIYWRIITADGFNQDVSELVDVMRELQTAYNEEVVQPTRGLTTSLTAALRTISEGDRGVDVPIQPLAFDIQDLENLEAPPPLNPLDPTYEGRLFREGHLDNKLVFGGFLLLIIAAWGSQIYAGRQRAKKQARIAHIQGKELFGVNSYKEGQEYATAEAISKRLEEYLKESEGLFSAEEVKQFLPFEGSMDWFQSDPDFMLFMMRHEGEKRGIDFTKADAWPKLMAEKYGESIHNMFHATVTAPEFLMLADMSSRYRDKEVLLSDMFKEILPGFFELTYYSRELTRLQEEEGLAADSPKLQYTSIEFFNVFTEMVMQHLEARVMYAQTKLDYYDQVYQDLKEDGEWTEGGIEGFSDLPTISYNFFDSANISKTDKDALEGIRDYGNRKAIISEIEQERNKERDTLGRIRGFLDTVDAAATDRIAKRNTSFLDRLTKLRSTLDRDTAVVKAGGDEYTADLTSRGALERIVREQLKSKIRIRIQEMRSRRSSNKTEYPIEDQLKSVAITLEHADKAAPLGDRWSFFMNDPRLGKYTCEAHPELRPAGYKGSIAEYYAVVFTVTEKNKGKNAPTLYEGEMPIELLFAKELSPDAVAEELGDWIQAHQEEVSLNVKVHALKEEVAALEREVTVPTEVPLSGRRAEGALTELFTNTLPEARRQRLLKWSKESILKVEGELPRIQETSNRATKRVNIRHEGWNRSFKAEFADPLSTVWKAEEQIETIKKDTGAIFEGQRKRVERIFEKVQERDQGIRRAGVDIAYIPPRSQGRGAIGTVRVRASGFFSFLTPVARRKFVNVPLKRFEELVTNPLNESDRAFRSALRGLLKSEQRTPSNVVELGDNGTDERLAA